MIKFSNFLFPLIILMMALSCNQQKQPQSIELNQGEKWKVIPEMMTHIRASETLFTNYIEEGDTDFIKLASGLKENNDKLIKSCTMKGKAHDELHKWLHPHLQLVEALGDANSHEDTSLIIEQLEMSFQALNTYFI